MAVRRERVILDLQDNFSSGMVRAAAATKTLDKALDGVARSNVSTSKSIGDTGAVSKDTAREIDRLSGRLGLFRDVAVTVGPALAPIGALAVPAIAGLAAQFGAAALATGTAVVAFQGVGDTLKAVNEAALEPTAENLEVARLAMQNLAPEARDFVAQIQEMRPAFAALRNAAAGGLFPGLTSAMIDAEGAFGRIEEVLWQVGNAAGELAEDFAEGLAGPRGQAFLEFVAREVPLALSELGHSVGNIAAGLGELWQAFTPLNRDFSSWLLEGARGFDEWAQGLSSTEGFKDFVEYIQTNGPRVADALGALGNALLQIVEAAAPLGGPVLMALEAVADAVAAIAGSDAGPAIMGTVTALALLSRGMKTFEAVSKTSWGTAIAGADTFGKKVAAARVGRGAAAFAGVGLAATGIADEFALANTASMALMGTLAGPWGAAVGGAVGLMLDLTASSEGFKINTEGLTATLDQQTGAITRRTEAWAASELETNGVLTAAETLGLNLEDVTQAALGNADAVDRVTAAMAAAKSELYDDEGVPIVGTAELMDFKDNMFLVQDGIGATTGALDEQQGAFQRVLAATGSAEEGYDRVTSAAERFRNELTRLNELLTDRASLRSYEASLDDARKTLNDMKDPSRLLNKAGNIDINIPKAREVQEQLDGIADNIAKVSERMKGTERQAFLTQGRQDMIDVANKLFDNRKRAAEFVDYLLRVDRMTARPKIELDPGSAEAKMAAIDQQLRNLDGTRATTYVETVYTSSGQRFKDVPSGVPTKKATGGPIFGPGSGTSDDVPIWASNGEHMWTAREVANAGGHAAVEAMRAQFRYAEGGAIGWQSERNAPSWRSQQTHSFAFAPAVVDIRMPDGRVQTAELRMREVARDEIAADKNFSGRLNDRD